MPHYLYDTQRKDLVRFPDNSLIPFDYLDDALKDKRDVDEVISSGDLDSDKVRHISKELVEEMKADLKLFIKLENERLKRKDEIDWEKL